MTAGATGAPDKRLTLIAAILGSLIVFLDATVVNVALPTLSDELDAGLSTQQWVVEAYLLTLGSLILVGGSMGDVFGRRLIFVIGLLGFGAASLLCALAPTGGFLIAARAVQGLAGALLVPCSLAIIVATFDEGERGAAIGSWTAWTAISTVVGPLVGGALVDLISWRAVFAINVPLVAVTLLLIDRGVAESRDPRARPELDWPGAVLCALGLAGVVFALTEQGTEGWGAVAPALAGGTVLLAAFLARERRAAQPMLPLRLFRSRNFAVGNLATVAVYGGLGATILFVTLYLQQVTGYSAFEAGLATAPATLLLFLLSRRLGALSERTGPRLPMTLGPLVAGAGLLSLMRVDAAGDYLADVLPGLLAFAIGLSLTVAPLTATVIGAIDRSHAGVASGVNNAIARIASLLAIALVGAVVAAEFTSTLEDATAGRPLGPAARVELERAKERALTDAGGEGLRRAGLSESVEEASVAAFRLGIGVAGALMILGGLISAIGIRNPPVKGRPGAASAAAGRPLAEHDHLR